MGPFAFLSLYGTNRLEYLVQSELFGGDILSESSVMADPAYTERTTVGETEYIVKPFFSGKTTLREIIMHRILKECEKPNTDISSK